MPLANLQLPLLLASSRIMALVTLRLAVEVAVHGVEEVLRNLGAELLGQWGALGSRHIRVYENPSEPLDPSFILHIYS